MSLKDLEQLELELLNHFTIINREHTIIRQKLFPYADGKKLKGDEIVGWLGEVYCKLLLDGTLVSDENEHDFVTVNGERISVKTRKGKEKGWNRTSAIPKKDGDNNPTHLMFVHLNDDYSIDRIWKFPWKDISGRFKEHKVRGSHRAFYFQVIPKSDDAKYLCYPMA
ncbi:MAG: hypothetical protein O8C66_11800 [Candidatus Methanoperedens sp.]|nr:hypothetical protein [Candidatus Methanoperedens sp.]MCZ7371185.1 hypothetical protein [Candidatus Methanoperedens sp.]